MPVPALAVSNGDALAQLRQKLASLKETSGAPTQVITDDKENFQQAGGQAHTEKPACTKAAAASKHKQQHNETPVLHTELHATQPLSTSPAAQSVAEVPPASRLAASTAPRRESTASGPTAKRRAIQCPTVAAAVVRKQPVPRQGLAQREALQAESERMQRELRQLRAELQASEDKASNLAQDKKNLSGRLKTEQGRTKDLRRQLEEIESTRAAPKASEDAPREQGPVFVKLHAQQRKIQELESENCELKRKNCELSTNLAIAQEDLAREKQQCAEKCHALELQLEKSESERAEKRDALVQEVDALQQQLAGARKQLKVSSDDADRWLQQYQEKSQQLIRAETSVDEMQRSMKESMSSREALTQKVSTLEAELIKARSDNTTLHTSIGRAKNQAYEAAAALASRDKMHAAALVLQRWWLRRSPSHHNMLKKLRCAFAARLVVATEMQAPATKKMVQRVPIKCRKKPTKLNSYSEIPDVTVGTHRNSTSEPSSQDCTVSYIF